MHRIKGTKSQIDTPKKKKKGIIQMLSQLFLTHLDVPNIKLFEQMVLVIFWGGPKAGNKPR